VRPSAAGMIGRLISAGRGWVALLRRRIIASEQAGLMRRHLVQVPAPRSGFAGFRLPPEMIMVAVR
jgi:hypothetical protein